MTMKKIVCIAFFVIASFTANAQDNRHDKIMSLKVAYLTEKLALTTTEAESFWPLYNAYSDNMHALKYKEMGSIKIKLRDVESLSETDAKQLYKKWMDIESQMCSERKDLLVKLQKVLPYKKIMMLQKAEGDFHRKLIERLKGEHRKKNEE